MRRPKIEIDGYQQANDYIANLEVNRRIQAAGFAVMRRTYGSDLHEQSPGLLARVNRYARAGNSLMLIMNHQSNADTPTFAAFTASEELAFLEGQTKIPAKASVQGLPIIGRFFDHMNAHPAFRTKDFAEAQILAGFNIEVADALIQAKADWIDSGRHTAEMPEGLRNTNDPRFLSKFKTGLGRTALALEKPERVAILPFGTAYESSFFRAPMRPVTVIGDLIEVAGMSIDDITEISQKTVQDLTLQAFSIVDFRRSA